MIFVGQSFTIFFRDFFSVTSSAPDYFQFTSFPPLRQTHCHAMNNEENHASFGIKMTQLNVQVINNTFFLQQITSLAWRN